MLISSSYANAGYEFTYSWASGNAYEEESGLTAPTVTVTYEPTTSSAEAGSEAVEITFVCGDVTKTLNTTANVVTKAPADGE